MKEFLPHLLIFFACAGGVFLIAKHLKKKKELDLKWNGIALIIAKQMTGLFQLLEVSKLAHRNACNREPKREVSIAPLCKKQQHHVAPFRHSFNLFCRERC